VTTESISIAIELPFPADQHLLWLRWTTYQTMLSVESKTDPECWSQPMDHCQEWAHLTNLGNHMMGAITEMTA
jgi:hypothetical protein